MEIIKQGQYYVCIKPMEDHEKGEHVLVTEVYPKEVHYKRDHTTWTSEPRVFLTHFLLDPEGDRKRLDRISQILTEFDQFNVQQAQLTTDLGTPSGETGLVKTGKLRMQKRQLAAAEAKIHHLNTAMQTKQQELMALVEEKKELLDLRLQDVQKLADRMREGIWTMNLYLGVDEEIVQLKSGKPCPETEKIKIRQRILYMDEECTLAADRGGIDFRELESFDKWISSRKKHLEQVLPEKKGMVALQIRRTDKNYGDDDFMNFCLNKANKTTYLLIRNGSNLYRICPDIHLSGTLFPAQDEFDDYFVSNWFGEHKQLRPGTKEFVDAMEQVDSRGRHYARILLILQGLLDRTEVFHPIEGGQINICDKRQSREILEFVHDDEMTLSDGKERFNDWVRRINSKLAVGHRIIGRFGDYSVSLDSERLYPYSARGPESEVLYTIEAREDDYFIIRYRRTEYWLRSSARARCKLLPSDGFILNFDVATVEEMEYFLGCRMDRHNYISMVPLLQTALELKKKEVAEEEPFVQLLTGQIMKKYKVQKEEAEKVVGELVYWWKFKNKTHRALTSKDSMALKEIVAEFGLRRTLEAEREKRQETGTRIVRLVREIDQKVVYIGHKKDNEYVSYSAHNDQNIFLRERTWKWNSNTDTMREVKDRGWILLDKRHERWLSLWEHDRWPKWRQDIRQNEVLADPEIRVILDKIIKGRERGRCHNDDRKLRYLPLAFTWDDNSKRYKFYFCSNHCIIPSGHFYTNEPELCTISRSKVVWKRDGQGVITGGIDWPSQINWTAKVMPWQNQWHKHETVVWKHDENVALLKDEWRRVDEVSTAHTQLAEKVHNMVWQLREQLCDQYEKKIYSEFVEDNDPSMWGQFKEKTNFMQQIPRLDWLDDRLGFMMERDDEVVSFTVRSIIKRTDAQGHKSKKWKQGYNQEIDNKKAQADDLRLFPSILELRVPEAKVEEED